MTEQLEQWRIKMLDDDWSAEFISSFVNLGIRASDITHNNNLITIVFKTKEDMDLYRLLGLPNGYLDEKFRYRLESDPPFIDEVWDNND